MRNSSLLKPIVAGLAIAAHTPAIAQSVTPIAATGQPTPGLAGFEFQAFERPFVNRHGDAVFWASIDDGNQLSASLWFYDGVAQQLQLIAKIGDPTTLNPDEVFTSFTQTPSINEMGEVVFRARVDTPSTPIESAIIFREAGRLFVDVARDGQAAPGTASNFDNLFTNLTKNQRVNLNVDGEVAFLADLEDGSRGIWAGAPGSLTAFVQTGELPPVSPVGFEDAKVNFIHEFDFNENGLVAFVASADNGKLGDIFEQGVERVLLLPAGGRGQPQLHKRPKPR